MAGALELGPFGPPSDIDDPAMVNAEDGFFRIDRSIGHNGLATRMYFNVMRQRKKLALHMLHDLMQRAGESTPIKRTVMKRGGVEVWRKQRQPGVRGPFFRVIVKIPGDDVPFVYDTSRPLRPGKSAFTFPHNKFPWEELGSSHFHVFKDQTSGQIVIAGKGSKDKPQRQSRRSQLPNTDAVLERITLVGERWNKALDCYVTVANLVFKVIHLLPARSAAVLQLAADDCMHIYLPVVLMDATGLKIRRGPNTARLERAQIAAAAVMARLLLLEDRAEWPKYRLVADQGCLLDDSVANSTVTVSWEGPCLLALEAPLEPGSAMLAHRNFRDWQGFYGFAPRHKQQQVVRGVGLRIILRPVEGMDPNEARALLQADSAAFRRRYYPPESEWNEEPMRAWVLRDDEGTAPPPATLLSPDPTVAPLPHLVTFVRLQVDRVDLTVRRGSKGVLPTSFQLNIPVLANYSAAGAVPVHAVALRTVFRPALPPSALQQRRDTLYIRP